MRAELGAAISVYAALTMVASPGWCGPAVGQFEIKSLSVEPGEVELQSQNAFAHAIPRRRVASGSGGLVGDDNSLPRRFHALEIEYGFSHVFKARLGIEFDNERQEDFATVAEANQFDHVQLDEVEGEAILVLKRRHGDGFGLGLLVEYEHPIEAESARTVLAGPIFEFGFGRWLASFNPSVIQFFGGENNDTGTSDDKRDFGYAASLKYTASDSIAVAVEAYGTVERLLGNGSAGEEARLLGDFHQHRIGPVVYWTLTPEKTAGGNDGAETKLGLGALLGLNDATPDVTTKLSFEVTF